MEENMLKSIKKLKKESKKAFNAKITMPQWAYVTVALVLLLLLGCETTKYKDDEPKDEVSIVTINLVAVEGSVDISAGAIVTLTNNDADSQDEYETFTTENRVVFTDIPYGVYTLKVCNNPLYVEYVFETLNIQSINVFHRAILLLFPEVILPSDLYDVNKFYIRMELRVFEPEFMGPGEIIIYHRLGLEGNFRLDIDGEPVNLYRYGDVPLMLEGFYEFVTGQTYQFRLNYTYHGPHEEIFSVTFPQEIAVEWPEFIDDGEIDISWKLHPDNSQNNDFNFFSIRKDTLPEHNEMLLPTQRDYAIPAGLIPFPGDGRVRIRLEQYNYAVSGHVAVISNRVGATAMYYNGVIRDSWPSHQSMSINPIKTQNKNNQTKE